MSESPQAERKRRRFWLTIGEAAAVIAVVIAGLSYWDSHRQHAEETRRAAEQSQVAAALVLRSAADADGKRLTLEAVDARQVIQSQRYYFPAAILGHAMEVAAARPQIDQGWIAGGLAKALEAAHAKGDGEARLPVAIVTDYVEAGEARQDRSLYLLGYAWRSRFLAGRQIILQGLALQRRGLALDPRAAVERAWRIQTSGAGPA
ncbi:MAG TPA: hypothetical protein VG166_06395 [Caulobacteraceae bacterium]|jgi:hypothetical protein|nr:hypothetical protein [Caulobacteraceae bacterium]